MGLIICTECRKTFSDKAVCCPKCGCPTVEVIKELQRHQESKAHAAKDLDVALYDNTRATSIHASTNHDVGRTSGNLIKYLIFFAVLAISIVITCFVCLSMPSIKIDPSDTNKHEDAMQNALSSTIQTPEAVSESESLVAQIPLTETVADGEEATIQNNSSGEAAEESAAAEGTVATGNRQSNLDWTPTDDNPDDNIYLYYKIELEGNTKNYHYLIKIDSGSNTLNISKTLFYNEWSRFEGGRITGIYFHSCEISWDNSAKTEGSFLFSGSEEYRFIISEGQMVVTTSGDDEYIIAGIYNLAIPE